MKKIFAFIIFSIILFACGKDPGTNNGGSGGVINCSGPTKSFAAEVNPIIQASCATNISCHGAGSTTGPGPLLNYSQINSVKTIIRSEVSSGHMPPGGGLTDNQRNAIICWIDNGAPNN